MQLEVALVLRQLNHAVRRLHPRAERVALGPADKLDLLALECLDLGRLLAGVVLRDRQLTQLTVASSPHQLVLLLQRTHNASAFSPHPYRC